ncbi:unnamed protein product [Calypogeia fissa]
MCGCKIGYGFVSGLQTQGYKACSTCGPSLEDMAKYSSNLQKIVYLGHTKFLPPEHDMRFDPLLFSSFDMPLGDERDIPRLPLLHIGRMWLIEWQTLRIPWCLEGVG